MAPKKVNIEYIASSTTRKATFKKRGVGMKKKAGELSALCGVDVCYVMYYREGEGKGESSVYPSVPEAMRVVDRFRSMPELHRCKKNMSGEDYLRERIGKLQEQLHKARRDTHRLETKLLLCDVLAGRRSLGGLKIEQLTSLDWMADSYIEKVGDCIASNRSRQQEAGVQADPPLPCAATTNVVAEAPPQQGWAFDFTAYGDSRRSIRIGGDVVHLGNSAQGLAWTNPGPGTSFPPV